MASDNCVETMGLVAAVTNYGWKSAADNTCTVALLATQCRCADNTVVTGARTAAILAVNQITCAAGVNCVAAVTPATTTAATTTAAAATGEGKGEGKGEGEGSGEGGKAGEGESKATLVVAVIALLVSFL